MSVSLFFKVGTLLMSQLFIVYSEYFWITVAKNAHIFSCTKVGANVKDAFWGGNDKYWLVKFNVSSQIAILYLSTVATRFAGQLRHGRHSREAMTIIIFSKVN